MDALTTLATDIAAALGDGWRAETTDDSSRRDLRHGDGRHLWLYCYTPSSHSGGADGDRVKIRGLFSSHPSGQPRDLVEPTITAAISRGAERIARDIDRRLMPTYRNNLATLDTHRATQDRQKVQRQEVADQIGALLPGAHPIRPLGISTNETAIGLAWSPSDDTRNAWSRPSLQFVLRDGAHTADLSFTRIPRELALDICRLIAATYPATPKAA